METTLLQQVYDKNRAIMSMPDEDMNDYLERIKEYWQPPREQVTPAALHEDTRQATTSTPPVPGKSCDSDITMNRAGEKFSMKRTPERKPGSSNRLKSASPSRDTEDSVGTAADDPSSDIVEIATSPVRLSPTKLPQNQPASPKRNPRKRRKNVPHDGTRDQRGIPSDTIIIDVDDPGTIKALAAAAAPKVSKRRGRTEVVKPPPLDLVPIASGSSPIKRKRSSVPNPKSNRQDVSFIQDPNGTWHEPDQEKAANKKGIPTAAGSKLLEDIKQRKANYSASRKEPRPIALRQQKTAKLADSSDDVSITSVSSSLTSSRSSSAAPQPPEKPAKGKRKAIVPAANTSAKRRCTKKDEKLPKLTPSELARYLQTEEGRKWIKPGGSKALEGCHIFYVTPDAKQATPPTQIRMEMLLRHGATLAPVFDPATVTQIITDAPSRAIVLQTLGLRRMTDIPDRIPTVTWSWAALGMNMANWPKEKRDQRFREDYWKHGAFSERLEAGMGLPKSSEPRKGKEKEKAVVDVDASHSHISDFTQGKAGPSTSEHGASRSSDPLDDGVGGVLPSPPDSPQPRAQLRADSPSKIDIDEDPLAEFYKLAIAEQADERAKAYYEVDDTDDEEDFPEYRPPKRGWICDSHDVPLPTCHNQDVVDKLAELKESYEAQPGEDARWRAFAYSKVIRALLSYPRRIRSFKEAKAIRGVGDKTATKIMEIIETGDLRQIGYELTDAVKTARLFRGIYGVGTSIAYKWYHAGCRTLDDLRKRKGGVKLTSVQKTGLEFYDDINDRMPRDEAKAIYDLIKPLALSLDPKLCIDIMGSYRRGNTTCGDIDILITRPPEDGKTRAGILQRLLHELHAAGIVTEDLALPEESEDALEGCYRGLCRLPHVPDSRRRRIDFLTVPYHSRGAALIYYTGDDIFNRAMRMKANKMGYSLNQRGLFADVVRDPRDRRVKLHDGRMLASETEQEIFRILKVPWQEPHQRVRATA
ncbi:hypothetical protein BKA70DRAFT_825893 [Coprinopsis sp. MPI-PUGE-AT-0042]|nr:hypothetical protein BKA70DRAFT_825893 [Coprinopsis sp. MPI-PUGE-AT-0042]